MSAQKGWRKLLATATAGLVVASGIALAPAAANAAPGTVADATLSWGVKSSFRNYIYNFAMFDGDSSLLGNTTQTAKTNGPDGVFNWSGGTGVGDTEGANADVSFGEGNGVHFQSHPMTVDGQQVYALDMTFTNPHVVVTSPTTGELRLDVEGYEFESMTSVGDPYAFDDVVLADLALAAPTNAGGTVTWTDAAATLTAEGSTAFGGFYPAGETLDPVTFSLPTTEVVPEATTTTLEVAPAASVVKGGDVTLTATLAPVEAQGEVQFFATDAEGAEQPIGAPVAVVDGVATLTTAEVPAGETSYRAEFAPNAFYVASESAPSAALRVIDTAQPELCSVGAGAKTYAGVDATWAWSAYSNEPNHTGGGGYAWTKVGGGNIAVDDTDFVLSDGTASVTADCTSIAFTGTARVEAYANFFPTNGQWVELVDPALVIDAAGNGAWTAEVRTGAGALNENSSERVAVATVSGAELPDFVDAGTASIVPDYAGTTAKGTWKSGYSDAWSNAFVNMIPSSIQAFYYASGAGSDAKKPAAPIELSWADAPVEIPFVDVQPGDKFYTEIAWMYTEGLSTGTKVGSEVYYRPANSVTREAMAAFLYRLAGEPAFTAPTKSPFADLKTGDRFYKEITWLASEGITTGTKIPGTNKANFLPREQISRAAMAAFMYRFAGEPSYSAPATSAFSDVKPGSGFYKEISWMHSTGISTGSKVGGKVVYQPKDAVKRNAMAAFVFRFDTWQNAAA
ncbi:HtaA domain-containing protein [Leucobacter allii]|uniref:HtaA domain-containing protein n=1 Tax=Leucobacter allii TaxID=2932247 RepID=A0ABY4FJS0_9MICO|nr:HtaA domain-containing protein [Leucobacter allii]UOQ56431.1 HtaA domain-containing protein [Leucobacter allii]